MKTIRKFILALAVSGCLLVLAAATVMAQPPIPHPVTGRDDCLACHGPQGVEPAPSSHVGRTNEMCRLCHQPGATSTGSPAPTATAPKPLTPGKVPVLPASHVGRTPDMCLGCHGATGIRPLPATHSGRSADTCLACHKAAATSATPAPLPQSTPRPIGTPIPLASGSIESSCASCHRRSGGALAAVVKDWEDSRHRSAGILCNTCHGGDPNAPTKAAAMSPAAGYIGIPDRRAIPDQCGSCHSDPARMRQYNLQTDQLAQYRTSLHGQLLQAGDKNVATCFDCHGGHAIRQPSDPQSTVYPMNVPATCASCHANADKMKPYGIPTDQLSKYSASVHGMTLLKKQDPRAPSCAGCHGNHGAVPPGVGEISNVCGQCHSATQDLYLQSGHSRAAATAGAPRCVTCHGQHDVALPSDDLLLGTEPRHCGSCHAATSSQGKIAADIATALKEASAAYGKAQLDVAAAEGGHLLVVAAVADLAAANTALVQARAAQHTANPATVKQYADSSAQSSAKVQQAAAKAMADTEVRRQMMLLVLAFVVVVALLIGYAKRKVDADLD